MFKTIRHRAGTSRANWFETLAAARVAAAVPRPPVQGTEVVRETPCPTCGRLDLECDRCVARDEGRP
jgi:hypothetical protein